MINIKDIVFSELIPVLKNVTVFAGLNDDDIVKICSNCTILQAKAGEIILEENQPATEIFIIVKGKVKIVLNLKEDPFELIEFGVGDCIGEASVIGIQNHSASAVTIEDATLLVLSRNVLMHIFDTDKGLFSFLILNIARELARRLHHTDEVLLHGGKFNRNNPELPVLNQLPLKKAH
jgi:CRP/FNR family cyclic AMP-dependent transcriptional regulator